MNLRGASLPLKAKGFSKWGPSVKYQGAKIQFENLRCRNPTHQGVLVLLQVLFVLRLLKNLVCFLWFGGNIITVFFFPRGLSKGRFDSLDLPFMKPSSGVPRALEALQPASPNLVQQVLLWMVNAQNPFRNTN